MIERPYRAALPEGSSQRLVFYPHFAPIWGLVGGLTGLASLLVPLVTRASPAWLVMPLLTAMLYATRGERHEITVNEHGVTLRRSLWPLNGRDRLLRRSDVVAVLLEEYDGEARIAIQTRTEGRIPLTEAFQTDLGAVTRVRGQLQQAIFPEE